ncbi:hypothetical protein ABEH94_22580 [Pantoea agglomerans]|uniref:hypothetical protein n=1 Tax=Enterobacter agglomerans TaxID=549 RepID=UPI003209907F
MKNNAQDISDEVRALIEHVATGRLSAGKAVTPEKLIQALYQFGENASDDEVRSDCLELMRQLIKKLH